MSTLSSIYKHYDVFIPKVFKSLETDRENYESRQRLLVSTSRLNISRTASSSFSNFVMFVKDYANELCRIKELERKLLESEFVNIENPKKKDVVKLVLESLRASRTGVVIWYVFLSPGVFRLLKK